MDLWNVGSYHNTTCCYYPEDLNLNLHHYENLKSCIMLHPECESRYIIAIPTCQVIRIISNAIIFSNRLNE